VALLNNSLITIIIAPALARIMERVIIIISNTMTEELALVQVSTHFLQIILISEFSQEKTSLTQPEYLGEIERVLNSFCNQVLTESVILLCILAPDLLALTFYCNPNLICI
jgi:hypothetical protein